MTLFLQLREHRIRILVRVGNLPVIHINTNECTSGVVRMRVCFLCIYYLVPPSIPPGILSLLCRIGLPLVPAGVESLAEALSLLVRCVLIPGETGLKCVSVWSVCQ